MAAELAPVMNYFMNHLTAHRSFGYSHPCYLLLAGWPYVEFSPSPGSPITPLRERVSLELRAELLNAFNHPTFAAPNTTPSSTAFGAVTALNQGARIPQFAVKLRF